MSARPDCRLHALHAALAKARALFMAETWLGHDMIAAEWAHEADRLVFRVQRLEREPRRHGPSHL